MPRRSKICVVHASALILVSALFNVVGEVKSQPLVEVQVVSGKSCGFGTFGSMMGIANSNTGQTIKAFYKISWSQNLNSGEIFGDSSIGPGQTVWIKCSRGGGVSGETNKLSITGASYE